MTGWSSTGVSLSNRIAELQPLYYDAPKRALPVLGFIGERDTGVLPLETEALLDCFADPVVVRSPHHGHIIFELGE